MTAAKQSFSNVPSAELAKWLDELFDHTETQDYHFEAKGDKIIFPVHKTPQWQHVGINRTADQVGNHYFNDINVTLAIYGVLKKGTEGQVTLSKDFRTVTIPASIINAKKLAQRTEHREHTHTGKQVQMDNAENELPAAQLNRLGLKSVEGRQFEAKANIFISLPLGYQEDAKGIRTKLVRELKKLDILNPGGDTQITIDRRNNIDIAVSAIDRKKLTQIAPKRLSAETLSHVAEGVQAKPIEEWNSLDKLHILQVTLGNVQTPKAMHKALDALIKQAGRQK